MKETFVSETFLHSREEEPTHTLNWFHERNAIHLLSQEPPMETSELKQAKNQEGHAHHAHPRTDSSDL